VGRGGGGVLGDQLREQRESKNLRLARPGQLSQGAETCPSPYQRTLLLAAISAAKKVAAGARG
jgi:hypothetical protein